MTRDLRRAHRVCWWVLPPLLAVLVGAAWIARGRAERALERGLVSPSEHEGAR